MSDKSFIKDPKILVLLVDEILEKVNDLKVNLSLFTSDLSEKEISDEELIDKLHQAALKT